MKIPVIKKLVQEHNDEALKLAEEALLEEQTPAIDIEGEDEGEQLTHVLAAREILGYISQGQSFPEALRNYTQRVRKSIS